MDYVWFYLLFYGSLGFGYWLRPWRRISSALMRSTLLFIDTPLFLYSFWILNLDQVRLYAPIPLVAAGLILLPLYLSPLWAKRLFSNKTAQGSFILSAAFSNIGTTGGAFICYLLFGLPGLTLAYLFLLPYPILIFSLGFSTAKQYASDQPLQLRDFITNITGNLFSLLPLIAIGIGLTLNGLGLTPPSGLKPWVDTWIKLGLGLMCLAIGMTLKFGHMFTSFKPIAALSVIKFLCLPLFALGFIFIIYGSLAPLPAKIILIQSAMPPALYAVITANLFGLDQDTVNSLWFSTTLFLIPIAGLLFWFLG